MKDNFFFWIDGDFSSYCIAYYLQQKLDYDAFAIIDITNKPKKFFQEQEFVKFKKTWYFHDYFQDIKKPDLDYLSSFEKKYNINLWNLAINERIFYRYNRIYKFKKNEILSILEHECKLFENILDEVKPDFFISHTPFLHNHELLHRMCKKQGITSLAISIPHISKCIISQEFKKMDSVDNLEGVNNTNRTSDDLMKYLKSFSRSDREKAVRQNFKTSTTEQLKASTSFLLSSNNSNMTTHYSYFGRTKLRVLLDSINMSLKRKTRQSFIDKNLIKEINLNKKFVFFPLGVDEDLTLLLKAPFYTNQIEMIRHIAKSLPIDYTLYVKENSSMKIRYWRSKSEYKEIMDIPNVCLLHPSFQSEELFKNCSLVITIGGSAGLESAFYGKPSIIFGDAGYSILPSVSKVKSIEDLPHAIRKSLDTKVNPSDLDKYLVLLEQNSVNFDLTEFENQYHNYFYYGGFLVDVEISQTKMKNFLDKNESIFENVISGYVNKINKIKESNIVNTTN